MNMNSNKWPQIKSVVAEALNLEPPLQQAYVKTACEGDDDLLAEVTELLRSVHKSEEEGFPGFQPDLHPPVNDPGDQENQIGQVIGSYEITERLGTGDIRAVYKAVRTDRASPSVAAIKFIKKEAVSDETIQRFKQECEILANLTHPNIARLHDSGLTPEGIPYQIMEFVDGKPVTNYCRERKPDLHAHLDLFLKICEPVIYAHRNQVVHRHLKPSNILVSEDGMVKLLDFGIVKFDTDRIKNADVHFTPLAMAAQYASPEQVTGDLVTTASDIYVLGLILYELITGRLPFDFREKSPGEIEQIIRTEKPMRPSEANIHRKELRKSAKDIDWICMKALRKDPKLRYESVQEFEEDLLRYKRNYPVHARPLTPGYRARKFISRNKTGIFAASLILLAAMLLFYGIKF